MSRKSLLGHSHVRLVWYPNTVLKAFLAESLIEGDVITLQLFMAKILNCHYKCLLCNSLLNI